MKVFSHYLLISAMAFSLVACTAKPDTSPATETLSDDQLALHALTDFLENLHTGKYDKAAQLYGGTYEIMINHNPEILPEDHVALLRNACTINGAQCLEMRSATQDEKISGSQFIFSVEFQNADGSLFVLGPCCGENDADFQSRSSFLFEVSKSTGGTFLVMDMVPYAP
jgi:hypothetical protein